MKEARSPNLPGRTECAAYALPALPLAALALPLYVIVPTFYSDVVGLPLAAVGVVLLAIRVFDAFADPLFGWLADRFSSRLGRRRGFFLLSLPLTAASAFMLFWPPGDAGLGYLGFWGALVSVGYTWTVLPYTAWGAELSDDYKRRSVIAAWRESATLVGTLLAIGLPFAIGLQTHDGVNGLAVVAVLVAVCLPLAGMVAALAVPEPIDRSTRNLRFSESLGFIGRNDAFLRLIVAFLLNGLANAIPATLFLYFVSDRLGSPELRGPFLFLYFLSAIAGVPLATLSARRLGKHRAWCLAMVLACLVFSLAGFLDHGDLYAFGAICIVTGILLGFDLVLPPAIQADVIDNDTAASGAQRSGFYFGAWSLATKLSLAGAVGMVFPLLSMVGFEPGDAANGTSALGALAILYAWLPILPKAVAIGLMWNFPIGEVEQQELRRRIADG
ncbi:MFS transporter [Rhizobiaceae bacterium n13]|uniref:MFS transporter n=1 Tax=Ferirhizobium litorale TaxID=2927786 RepID=A0AAE3QEZ8_9HYPH|nr:MFS transporter [Fererhizobium litorale]MDI7862627.1 MFS transporter [Fererhizobium litorale]MDI7923890.1 MFS transporter [Fererhizobium litorale]